MSSQRYCFLAVLWLGLLCVVYSSDAVMFQSTSDPSYNTNTPGGSLTNSGWQYQGQWNTAAGGFLGTPIAPRFFVAAKHVGGSTNNIFWLDGIAFHPVRGWASPSADLIIWEVAETFPRFAPLFTGSNEIGQSCIVFGRGTRRGAEVNINSQLKGWRWGTADGVQRWGLNTVADIEYVAGVGDLLSATFSRNGGSNECHLSGGDSSGGLFIQNDGVWKLAGLHYSVDGFFSLIGSSADQFSAALVDMGGLYVGSGSNWTYISDTGVDKPSSFYSTRISANLGWINGIINFQPAADLRAMEIDNTTNGITLRFPTVTNRLYRIETSETLAADSWVIWTNNIAGTGGPVSVLDTNAASLPRRFYRLGLDR